jgi:DmsE family decaheme c-type cytochrome
MRYRTFLHFPTLQREIAWWVIAAGFFIFPGGGAMAAFAAGEPCLDCHEETATDFNLSFHAKAWSGAHDCQSCHGSTDLHLDDPSQENIISFNKDSARSAQELSGVCLECHAESSNLIYWAMGQHRANDVQCTACHTIHARRATVNQLSVCFACHRETKAQVSKQSRHPVLEGKIQCSDCHNPHGTLSRAMIKAETPNLLCYTCHVDKRGPFIWVHPPAEENCLICHTPHGSRHENLFAERIHVLCQDCHDDRSHHGAAYDATSGFGGANESNRFVARGCVECHHTMHGSVNFRRSFSR